MEGSEASVRDYYYQRAPFFPSSSARLYERYAFRGYRSQCTYGGKKRRARGGGRDRREGRAGPLRRGTADAPSSLIKTDRPLFFLRPSNNEIYFIIPPNSLAAWTSARNFSGDSIPRKNLIKVMITIMAATMRSNLSLCCARARAARPPGRRVGEGEVDADLQTQSAGNV